MPRAMWEYWKAVPMRHWETRYNGLGTDERMKLCDSAAQAATWLARLSAYVSRRMSGGKHGDAVKAQNRAARRVRQALGYTYADDKVTF